MSWMSKNGYDSPARISPYETEFVNTFPGGLLYTCGLRSAGPANRDNGEWHPLHGRYHSLQAEQVCAKIADNEIIVKGTLRETALFGHALEVKRTIRIPVFGTSVTVQDTVTNQTPRDEEIMQIYHCLVGRYAADPLPVAQHGQRRLRPRPGAHQLLHHGPPRRARKRHPSGTQGMGKYYQYCQYYFFGGELKWLRK